MINTMNDSFADFAKPALPVKKFRKNSKNKNFHASKKIWMDENASLNNQQICFKKFCYSRRANLRETDTERSYQQTEEEPTFVRLEPFQVFVTLQGRTFNHIMAPGYLYDSIVTSIKDKFQLSECHYYLRVDGIILSQFHYFKCTGKPYFIEVCIKGVGGSKTITVKSKCRTCGKMHSRDRCPDSDALSKEESSKGKSEVSNSSSSEGTVDTKAYMTKLLTDAAQGNLKDTKREVLNSMCEFNPELLTEIVAELEQEEIKFTQESCNYDTSHTRPENRPYKQNEKSKVAGFGKHANSVYLESSTSVKDLVARQAFHKTEPESKLSMAAPIEILGKDMPTEDPYKLLRFDYFLPGEHFYLFKTRTVHSGELASFICQYLNTTSSMASSPVNLANTLILLFREKVTIQYVKNMSNVDLMNLYKMILAYYSSIQWNLVTKDSHKILALANAMKKENIEELKNDSPFGVTFKRVSQTVKIAAQDAITNLTKRVIHNYSNGKVVDKVKSWWKRTEDYFLPDNRKYDDDDFDGMDNNKRMINYGTTTLKFNDQCVELDSFSTMTEQSSESCELDSLVEIDDNYVPIAVKLDYLKPTESAVLQFIENRDNREAAESLNKSCPLPVDPIDAIVQEAEKYLEECRIQGELHSIDLSSASGSSEKTETKKAAKKRNKENREKQLRSKIVCDPVFEPKKDNMMAIFPSYPKASAVIEEVVKQFVPYGSTIIGLVDDWVNGSNHRARWHANSMRYSFFDRIDAHVEHNRMCQDSGLKAYYEHFSNSDQIMPNSVQSEINLLSPGAALSAVPLPIINAELRDVYPYAHVNNSFVALEKKTQLQKFYPLLFAINNFVSYGNTNENFVAAVLCRLLYPKTSGPEPGEWKEIIDGIQIFSFDFIPDFELWFSELNPKQKAEVKRHLEALEKGDKINTETKVFLKMKELLKKSSKGYGRLIFNVSTKYLLLLGDFLAQFSKAMVASLFPPVPTYTISNIACFHYASTFSDVNLNTFVNIAMKSSCGKFVLVLGDDTMIIDRDVGKYTEIDFTAYDSTQVKGGALDLFPVLLRKMGCVEQADAYEQMYAEKIQWKHSSGEKLEMPDNWKTSPSRMSGEPGTSVANSYTTIMATKAVLEGQTTYSRLGFVAKQKDFQNLETTFLKGIFLYSRANDKWYWTRLPSFILKLKSFTEPKTIYPKFTVEKAQQQLLWSQWLGFGNTQTNWFYVEMTKIVRRLCPLAANVELKEEYKVYTEEAFYIDDCEFDAMMLNRYGITRQESEDYLAFLTKEAIALPIIYQHSLTDKLFDIDT